VFGAIWLASLALAAAVILALLSVHEEDAWVTPPKLPDLAGAQVVFIGSSLARFALPRQVPEGGVLGDERTCAMLATPGISEHLSTLMLEHAIVSGAETVFVEINAYALESLRLGEPAVLYPLVIGLRLAGDRMSRTLRGLAGALVPGRYDARQWPRGDLDCGAPGKEGDYLDVDQLAREDFYQLVAIEPAEPEALQRALDLARERGAEVIFFAPPRPRSVVDAMGSAQFARVQERLSRTAARFGVPLWSSPEPWPDDQFMDIRAHAAALGRTRFRDELVHWYAAQP